MNEKSDQTTLAMRLVFMGTPEFAVASLAAILEAGYEVAAVVTAPDRPAGRGQLVTASAVKTFALSKNLVILQPEKLKDQGFVDTLRAFGADLFVVVAFRMLPEVIWKMPRMGTINLHGSLLPRYRGAAPINRAIMNGEKETGVTTFFLQEEIDSGRIILRRTIPIGPEETAGELHDRMMRIGGECVVETLRLIETGNASGTTQEELINAGETVIHAPKIFREDCQIDWKKTVDQVHDHIRGLSPYPAAWTTLDGKNLKIFSGAKQHTDHDQQAGHMETDGKSYLRFACGDGWYSVHVLQAEGKKKMSTEEFLRGFRK
jgi:methionyl-tRNA formyltransferase